MSVRTTRQQGFTLIEIAIVLMIVGLLLGGMLVPLTAQMEQQKVSASEKQLAEAREALIGYALANGQLPCPANPALATGQPGAGIARTPPCTNGNSAGVLPWATLGISETDAWGNRFTYRVSSDFADALGTTFGKDQNGNNCIPAITPTQATFALCSAGTLDVLAAAGGANVAIDVPAVIISHGKSGSGAYTQQGTQQPLSGNADEQENSDGDTSYVYHTPTPDYDDLTTWVSPNILLNRMVAAGKLP
jgi:prepilin-type N-terminal cleavage/methylation domain-containing protein